MQELQKLPAHEAPWAAAATLHCMAALPAEPGTLPGPVTRAARAVLHSCCLLQNTSARIAVYEAVRAAAQRHQATAGDLPASHALAAGPAPARHFHELRMLMVLLPSQERPSLCMLYYADQRFM